ncbi:MAG: bifunctional methylenetetrahydrofolate dehydrogenase/methenyltetrahydrofolate cyclohydrolase FolD [Candidatus Riflebacteria bacterium]|nr:bifunctional methylenetetrahydrofolate dehydrogenase/methenyltetrahydrofolate cyclohydrolase FolD [Candidatus Riflebacteria bacterium]
MAQLLDGLRVSAEIREAVRVETAALSASGKPVPGLAVVLVGEDPASRVYVGRKKKACQEVGFHSLELKLSAETTQSDLLARVSELNHDSHIHGILVQMPLPAHIDEHKIIEAIDPRKDVDGFHPINVGKLLQGVDGTISCTPGGVIELLHRYRIELKGKKALVIGRSNIVGKPMAVLLIRENATVTIAHSHTKNLEAEIKASDIIVAAIGKPRMIRGEWIKQGAVVVDIGMNQIEDLTTEKKTRLVGDVDFETARERASFITPVPGGIGPMTIAMLLSNTLKAYKTLTNSPTPLSAL